MQKLLSTLWQNKVWKDFYYFFFMMNSDISFIGAVEEIKDKICHVMSFLAWFLGAFKGALGEM